MFANCSFEEFHGDVAELPGLRYEGAMSAMRPIIEIRSGLAGSALLGLLLSSP